MLAMSSEGCQVTDQDIRARLSLEGDNWVERQRAELIHRAIEQDKRDRREALAAMVLGGTFAVLMLCCAVYVVLSLW